MNSSSAFFYASFSFNSDHFTYWEIYLDYPELQKHQTKLRNYAPALRNKF